jgi:hypothetical protein
MTDVNDDPPRDSSTAPKSDRVRLARLARDAALQVPGVADTDSGTTGLFATAGGGERVPGVTCVAAHAGGYDVALRLRCELVPLPALGEHVNVAVRQATAVGDLPVAGLRVEIVDVVEPGCA